MRAPNEAGISGPDHTSTLYLGTVLGAWDRTEDTRHVSIRHHDHPQNERAEDAPETLGANASRLPFLTDLADDCRAIYRVAVATLGPDLGGGSLLDLVADRLPRPSLEDLRAALAISGIAR